MSGHRIKNLIYKEAKLLKNVGTLQQHLSDAHTQRPLVKDRLRKMGDGVAHMVLNHLRKQKTMLFGQLVLYSEGVHQYLLSASKNAKEYDLEEHALPNKDDGKEREFLDSVLYFGILDNHVVLAQSSSLRAREFEGYLNWFFHDCTNVLDGENGLILCDHTSTATRKKILNAHVKSVSLGSPLEAKPNLDFSLAKQTSSQNNVKKVKFIPTGNAFSILRAALGEEWFKEIKLKDSLDGANIEVRLEVTYLRKTTDNAHNILDNIALSMRHAEPNDVVIHLNGGGEVKGTELKIYGSVSVIAYNGLIDQEDLYIKIQEWLKSKIDQELIDP